MNDKNGTSGVSTNIEPSFIQRVVSGLKYAVTGSRPEWFGPAQPIAAQAQEATEGRQFDYQVGYNLQIRPRSGEVVPFDVMRNLAENYDVMRIIMENAKDVLCEMEWTIRPKDGSKPNRQCKKIETFLQYPDRENDWQTWLRALLEDMFVIDAATVYPRKNRGGDLYALEYIDGATIKPVLNIDGRRPEAPEVAYQQILKGIPTADYSVEELYYMPRNRRTHKVYGYSNVEQMITTVNMAIRRQLYQIQLYTEGSTPDMLISCPSSWQPEQIVRFQAHWDSLLKGNTANQRGTVFMPDGAKSINTKEHALKSEDDEWLARLAAYCFGVEATPFIKQVNRSTSETVREQALAEGKAPRASWIKNRMTYIINQAFMSPDLEFAFVEEESISPLERAQIHQIYAQLNAIDENEIREDLGKDPLTPEQQAAIKAKTQAATEPKPGDEAGDKPDDEKAKDSAEDDAEQKPVAKVDSLDDDENDDTQDEDASRTAAALKKKEQRIERLKSLILSILGLLLPRITRSVNALDGLSGEELKAAAEKAIQSAVELSPQEAQRISKTLSAVLSPTALEAATVSINSVIPSATKEQLAALAETTNKIAVDRAAEMLGFKIVDGELNLDTSEEWAITKSTAEMAVMEIERGIATGKTLTEIVAAIKENKAFSADRADLISRTEIGNAINEGMIQGWAESGVVTGKISILAEGDIHHGEDDILNASAGVVPLLEPFPSGHYAPLYHPNCLCTLQPVIDQEPV